MICRHCWQPGNPSPRAGSAFDAREVAGSRGPRISRRSWRNRARAARYVSPTGQPASFNRERYRSPELSRIIDQMARLTVDDPKNVEYGTALLQEHVKGMPLIPMFGTSKFVPVNMTYWKNYPTAANYYEGPWWWSSFKYIVARREPGQ